MIKNNDEKLVTRKDLPDEKAETLLLQMTEALGFKITKAIVFAYSPDANQGGPAIVAPVIGSFNQYELSKVTEVAAGLLLAFQDIEFDRRNTYIR